MDFVDVYDSETDWNEIVSDKAFKGWRVKTYEKKTIENVVKSVGVKNSR